MAAHGARRLLPMAANLGRIVAIEALCAAQGVEYRAPLRTSAPLAAVLARLRAAVAPLREDRALGADIEAAARLVHDGALVAAGGIAPPTLAPDTAADIAPDRRPA
jgi:histidine ammonia-lyase